MGMKQDVIPLSVPNFSGNERAYVNDAVVSEWVSTGGSMVGKFEEVLANYVGMPEAVACASGTAGLHLAMLVAGVERDDEVIAPTLTFIAAVNPIRYVGAWPVYIGCDEYLCLLPEAVADFCQNRCEMKGGALYNKSSGRRVKALEVVHVFGNMCDMERLVDIAKTYNLVLIEDATEALGTRYTAGRYAGKMAGTIGDIGVYSFNGNKIITTGSGGMLVSNRPAWTAHAKHLSTQAKSDELRYYHDEVGYNYRLTNLQAALGLAQMEQLEGFIAHKEQLYARYREALHGVRGMALLPFRAGVRANRWFFSLYLKNAATGRDALMEQLAAEGIQTRPIWGLNHAQPPYLGCEAHGIAAAEDYWAHVVNLPCSTNLAPEAQQRVMDAILQHV